MEDESIQYLTSVNARDKFVSTSSKSANIDGPSMLGNTKKMKFEN